MPDFSHYAGHYYSPARFSQIVARGTVITDDILLKVFNRIDPPLLAPLQAEFVSAILERRHGRRLGRGIPSPNWLAKRIAAINRPDVDPLYLAALAVRIKSGRGTTNFERDKNFHCQLMTNERRMLIRGTYWQFRKFLADKPDRVIHPVFGEVEVPSGMPPQMQAAEMTLQIMSGKLGYPWIAHRGIIKIASMRQYNAAIKGPARSKTMR